MVKYYIQFTCLLEGPGHVNKNMLMFFFLGSVALDLHLASVQCYIYHFINSQTEAE